MRTSPYRVALIGGGKPNAFFGKAHRDAISLDFIERRLVAGVLSSNRDLSVIYGHDWNLDYPMAGIEELIARVAEARIDYVTVATPNNQHAKAAIALLEAGIPVLLEKPIAGTLDDAQAIYDAAEKTGVPLRLAHTYTGFPMYMWAQHLVQSGAIGTIRMATVTYEQGWLADLIEADETASGHLQAVGRTDPAIAGISCCGGDIGSHAYIALRRITGLCVENIAAMTSAQVPGRTPLEDDFRALIKMENGATATLITTQLDRPMMNHHTFRIVGSEKTIYWDEERGEELQIGDDTGTTIIGPGQISGEISTMINLPPGHSGGFYRALANVHRLMCDAIRVWRGEIPIYPSLSIPDHKDGLETMQFVSRCLESSEDERFYAMP